MIKDPAVRGADMEKVRNQCQRPAQGVYAKDLPGMNHEMAETHIFDPGLARAMWYFNPHARRVLSIVCVRHNGLAFSGAIATP